MKEKLPIPRNVIDGKFEEMGIKEAGRASIREIVRIANHLESETGVKFIRMEMGVPGLPAAEIGVEAEIKALRNGVASIYPSIEGIPQLKEEIAKFAELFLEVKTHPRCCIPCVGSMQGAFATFLVSCRRDRKKDFTLFIDPGFPVQKQQHRVTGLKFRSFDVYEWRGERLETKLREELAKGDVSSIVYSSPNNPSWICLTRRELEIIGRLATEFDAVVIEDLAYFGMDFREDYSKPGVPPYQPTVAKFTDNYVLLISSSKAFSYAGQRIACIIISDKLFDRSFPDLKIYFSSEKFGHTLIYGSLYSLSAGTAHSAQFALAALLRETNDGKYNFMEAVKEYGKRSAAVKKIFLSNGFELVYDKDEDKPLADGFYFTISRPGFGGGELLKELLCYGIGSISLEITGSDHSEGLRACVSQIGTELFATLEERLKLFNQKHGNH